MMLFILLHLSFLCAVFGKGARIYDAFALNNVHFDVKHRILRFLPPSFICSSFEKEYEERMVWSLLELGQAVRNATFLVVGYYINVL